MKESLPCHVDFPAAHSMDATWFAIDQDGHIGVFDSGEPGAVPKDVNESIGQEDDAVLQALEPLQVIGEPRFELSGVSHPGLRSGELPRRRVLPRGWPVEAGMEALLLWDESPLTPAVRALPGLEVDRVDQFVLVSLKPSVELEYRDPRSRVWDEFKRVLGAGKSYVTSIALYGPELAVARRGLFVYAAHDDRFNLPEPYGKLLAPQRPLSLDQAPRGLRNVLTTRARLDISFASSPYVQPAELIPCAVWQPEGLYLASDGFTVRLLPGTHPAVFGSAAKQLRHDALPQEEARYKPVVFDPPIE